MGKRIVGFGSTTQKVNNMGQSVSDAMKELSELELIHEYKKSGNQLLVAELYQRHVRHIMTICLKYLGNFDWHQDAASEIYLKLVKEINDGTFRSRQDFKNWLAVLVKNHCIEKLRKVKSEKNIFREEKNITNLNYYVEFQLVDRSNNVSPGELRQALESLSEAQRRCLELFFFDGYMVTEAILEKLKSIGAPDEILEKAKTIKDKEIRGEGFFYDLLTPTVNKNENGRYELEILKLALFSEKMSYNEIGATTGYSLKEVKSHIQTGKIRLKTTLTKIEQERNVSDK